jgi:hypothetical protein
VPRARAGRCRADSAVFGYLLAELALTLATDQVAYWAHWITLEERPIRYDTRFFVAEARQDHRPEPDGLETVAARWVAPGDAPFPTQRILASLAEHRDVAALLAAARGREIRPVRPRIVRDASGERILLPQDPGWY